MRKILIFAIALFAFFMATCSCYSHDVTYTDDDPFYLAMNGDELNILQLTDIHLTYGIDSNDRKTLEGIKTLVKSEAWDLVVITGDMAMSISGPVLFKKLVNVMESLETPWTFVFGNHETDYSNYSDYLKYTENTEYLYFKVGPELEEGGVGNFRIIFTKDENPFYTLYFLDSHAERLSYTEEEGEYDYIHSSQVDWVSLHQSEDTTDSLMYFHIPLRQMMNPDTYTGIFEEDKVYAQGIDTGLFDVLVSYGLTKGIFVGHDHLNDFEMTKDGILLAYGQITGYNAYGDLERGGRVVHIDSSGVMSSYILLESEVSS